MWHGAAWNFIIWGIYFAVVLIIEKLFLLKFLNKTKVIGRVYTLIVVVISFVIFNASDMKEAFSYIGGMFGAGEVPLVSKELVYYLKNFAVVIILGIIGATPVVKKAVEKIAEYKCASRVLVVVEPLVLVVLMVSITAYLVDGSFNPFLYFRF